MRQITFQKVLEVDSVKQAELGELCVTPDGRMWRYQYANEALSKGHALTRIANTDVDTVSSSTDEDGHITKIAEASAGWTAGQFAESYGVVDDGTGEGQVFKVRTNSADTLFLHKDYRLTTALAVADSDIFIARPFYAEKAAVTVLNQIPSGVAQVAFAAADYGWTLVSGLGVIVAGDVLVANEQCTPGDDTEGEVIAITNGETPDDISTYGRTVGANTTADKGALVAVDLW